MVMANNLFYIGLMLLLISFVAQEIIGFFMIPTKVLVNLNPIVLFMKMLVVAFFMFLYPYAEKDKSTLVFLTVFVYIIFALSLTYTIFNLVV